MKQKTANLGFNFAALPPSSRSARATTENSVVLAGEPDISDCDGRYGFTRSWEWIRQIPVPENWSGAPVPVTLSVTADDSAMLTMGGLSVSASYSGGPGEDETTGALKPGYYQARMSFTNIDYEPPEGNVAVLSWSISAGVSGTLVPEENPKPIREADCTCGDDDSGGTRPAVSRSRAASASSSSSAGRNTRLETKESHVRWRTDFGKFRGMGGVPAGALEITAHEFSSASATPAALEFSHPFNSWLVLPPSGVAANAQLKLFCGGSCTSWMCDGNGETFFPLGASSGETSALRWNADKSAIEQVFPDKSVLAFSAGTGEIVSFKTRHGNAFSAAELSAYVDVVRDAVSRVALCTGAGASLMEDARASGCDLYLTADLRYNDFFLPDGDFTVADIGHFESEFCAIRILFDILSKKITNFALRESARTRNPVHYSM